MDHLCPLFWSIDAFVVLTLLFKPQEGQESVSLEQFPMVFVGDL